MQKFSLIELLSAWLINHFLLHNFVENRQQVHKLFRLAFGFFQEIYADPIHKQVQIKLNFFMEDNIKVDRIQKVNYFVKDHRK